MDLANVTIDYFCQDQTEEKDRIKSMSPEQAILASQQLRHTRWSAFTVLGGLDKIEAIVEALGHDPAAYDLFGAKTGRCSNSSIAVVYLNSNYEQTFAYCDSVCEIRETTEFSPRYVLFFRNEVYLDSSEKFVIPHPGFKYVFALEKKVNKVQQASRKQEVKQALHKALLFI